jgi:hypothetical protein
MDAKSMLDKYFLTCVQDALHYLYLLFFPRQRRPIDDLDLWCRELLDVTIQWVFSVEDSVSVLFCIVGFPDD